MPLLSSETEPVPLRKKVIITLIGFAVVAAILIVTDTRSKHSIVVDALRKKARSTELKSSYDPGVGQTTTYEFFVFETEQTKLRDLIKQQCIPPDWKTELGSEACFVVTNGEGSVESISWIGNFGWEDGNRQLGSQAMVVYRRSWYTVAIDKIRKFLKI